MQHHVALVFWLSLSACYGEIEPLGGDDVASAPDGGTVTGAITWQKTIGPLMVRAKCTRCHGTPGRYSVETYAAALASGMDQVPNVIANNAASALVTYCMQRHGGMTASDAELVRSWVMTGACER